MGPFPSDYLEEIMRVEVKKSDLKYESVIDFNSFEISVQQLTDEQKLAIFHLLDALTIENETHSCNLNQIV